MKDFIIFSIDARSYALDIALIHRIIDTPTIRAVPNEHEYVAGVISYENRILKVLDLSKVIGVPTVSSDSLQKSLIYEDSNKIFAIIVDSIDDIFHIDSVNIKKSNQDDTTNIVQMEGVFEKDAKLVNIIKSVALPKKEVL